MLVLTQKEGEILQVGDNVRIYIKRIKGNWVRLCIDAPKEVELKRIPAPRGSEEEQEATVREPVREAAPARDAAAPREVERRVVRIARGR